MCRAPVAAKTSPNGEEEEAEEEEEEEEESNNTNLHSEECSVKGGQVLEYNNCE